MTVAVLVMSAWELAAAGHQCPALLQVPLQLC
jgi:hypothetical protein